jgi:hypothetical protein
MVQGKLPILGGHTYWPLLQRCGVHIHSKSTPDTKATKHLLKSGLGSDGASLEAGLFVVDKLVYRARKLRFTSWIAKNHLFVEQTKNAL